MTDLESIKIENIRLCVKYIKKTFMNTLSEFHILTLSNMLAMHYSLTKQSENITDFILQCIVKVKNFIDGKILFDNDFSTTLALFAISIQNHKNDSDLDEKSLYNEIADVIVNSIYPNLDPNEKKLAIRLISKILNSEDVLGCINFIYANQEIIVDSIINVNYRNFDLKTACLDIERKSQIFSQSKNNVQIKSDLFSMITTILTTSAIVGGSTLLGFLAPIAIVPATLIGISFGYKLNQLIENNFKSSSNSAKDSDIKPWKSNDLNHDSKNSFSKEIDSKKINEIIIDKNDLNVFVKAGLTLDKSQEQTISKKHKAKFLENKKQNTKII